MYNKIDKDQMLRDEWRQLGFYYESDEESKEWKIFCDKKSVTNLAVILNDYCSHENNLGLSETYSPWSL